MKNLFTFFILISFAFYGNAQCGIGQSEVYLTISGGSYPSEKWVNITTEPNGAGTVIWAQGNGTYGNGADFLNNEPFCVDNGTTYYINAYDKYDDGWVGTIYEITVEEGNIIANNNGISPNDTNDEDASNIWGDSQEQELEISEAFSFTPPSCPTPTNIAATYITNTSANISWISGGASNYNIVFGESGFNIADSTYISVTDTFYNINGLSSSTVYDFYVRDSCGATDISNWRGPYTFSTECTTIATFPWHDSFESNNNLTCWNNEGTSEYIWEINDGRSYGLAHTSDGDSVAMFNSWEAQYGKTATLTSPLFDLSAIQNPTLSFDFWMNGADDDNLWLKVETTTNGSSWTEVFFQSQDGTISEWTSVAIVLENTNIKFRITGMSNQGAYVMFVDNIVMKEVTCPPTTNLFASNILSNSATLSWTSGGSNNYNLVYGLTGFNRADSTAISTTNTFYNINGLTSSETYDFYVQDSCGISDTSEWVGPYTFTTECNPITTFPWSESFEDNFDLACWHNEGTSAYVWQLSGSSSYGPDSILHGDTAVMFDVYHANRNESATLTSPLFDLTLIDNPTLTFDYWMNGDTDNDLWLKVETSTDASTWTEVYSQAQDGTISDWASASIILTDINANTKFRFIANSDYGSYNIFVDNVEIHEVTCIAPSNITMLNASPFSVTLSWLSGGASNYNFVYGETGFNMLDSTFVATTDTFCNLTNLSSATYYDFYIQDSCGVGDLSEWVGPFTFVTECAVVSSFPFTENFENNGEIPMCWSNISNTNDFWLFNIPSTSMGNADYGPAATGDHTSGSGYVAWIDDSQEPIANPAILETPIFDLSSLTNPELTFWYWIGENEYTSSLRIDIYDGATWHNNVDSITANGQWDKKIINLSSYSSTATSIRFAAFESNTFDSFESDIAIDDITVHEAPTCPNPTNLMVSNITDETATFSWISSGASNYNVQYGLSGFNMIGGTTVSVTDTFYNVSGLSANIVYEFYVQDSCSASDVSEWVGPFEFQTYCAYDLTWTESFEDMVNDGDFPTCVDYTGDFNVRTSPQSYNREARTGTNYLYTNYDANDWFFTVGVNLTAGESYDFSYWVITDGLTGWEEVTSWVGTSQTENGMTDSLTSELNLINTEYIEIRTAYTAPTTGIYFFGIHVVANASPWFITFDDLKVEVSPTCAAPTNFSIANITDNSASTNWISGGASNYNLVYGITGFNVSDNTIVNLTSTSYNLNGLDANSTYDIYIRDSCGTNDVSEWRGPYSFTTECSIINSFPWVESFESNFTACWENTGTANEAWVIDDGTTYGPSYATDGDSVAMFNVYDIATGNTATLGQNFILRCWENK